jgi:hypothetical protein
LIRWVAGLGVEAGLTVKEEWELMTEVMEVLKEE